MVDDRNFVDLTIHRGHVHAATRMAVYRYENGDFIDIKPDDGYRHHSRVFELDDGKQYLPAPQEFGPTSHIISHAGAIYGLWGNNLFLFDGFAIQPNTADWGILRTGNTRDMISLGNRIYIATDRGLVMQRGYTLRTLTGKDGLPYEDVTCLAEGFDGELWIGTTEGAIRKVGDGDYHYFAAQRWLPDNHVNDIAAGQVAGTNVVYVATNGGLGVIEYVPFTLRKKAEVLENYLDEWGHLRHGFAHRIRWDDRLAFMSLFTAIKYVQDPRLETIYRQSLERSWEIKRIEQFGWFNMVYGIITGNEFEADATAAHLREWSASL